MPISPAGRRGFDPHASERVDGESGMLGPVRARGLFVAAAACGVVHALFSLYWGAGGGWLLDTLGERIVNAFRGWEWLLLVVGVVKLVGAVLPWWLDAAGWPVRRWGRGLCWAAAVVLVGWGGANTIVGQLVLAGVIQPKGGYDRAGMVGHAFLWDPLFLVWGLCLGAGLVVGRRPRI
jgi:Protein of unknown function (DUF3995)